MCPAVVQDINKLLSGDRNYFPNTHTVLKSELCLSRYLIISITDSIILTAFQDVGQKPTNP